MKKYAELSCFENVKDGIYKEIEKLEAEIHLLKYPQGEIKHAYINSYEAVFIYGDKKFYILINANSIKRHRRNGKYLEIVYDWNGAEKIQKFVIGKELTEIDENINFENCEYVEVKCLR